MYAQYFSLINLNFSTINLCYCHFLSPSNSPCLLSVPLDLNHLDLVLLLLALVLGDDNQVSVGTLEDLLDGVVEDPLHVDPPQRSYQLPLRCDIGKLRTLSTLSTLT